MLSTTVGLALENVVLDARQVGTEVWIAGASPEALRLLETLGLFGAGVKQTDSRLEALRAATAGLPGITTSDRRP